MDETHMAIGLMQEAAARRRYRDDWEQDLYRLEQESANNEFKLRIVRAIGRILWPFRRPSALPRAVRV